MWIGGSGGKIGVSSFFLCLKNELTPIFFPDTDFSRFFPVIKLNPRLHMGQPLIIHLLHPDPNIRGLYLLDDWHVHHRNFRPHCPPILPLLVR